MSKKPLTDAQRKAADGIVKIAADNKLRLADLAKLIVLVDPQAALVATSAAGIAGCIQVTDNMAKEGQIDRDDSYRLIVSMGVGFLKFLQTIKERLGEVKL